MIIMTLKALFALSFYHNNHDISINLFAKLLKNFLFAIRRRVLFAHNLSTFRIEFTICKVIRKYK